MSTVCSVGVAITDSFRLYVDKEIDIQKHFGVNFSQKLDSCFWVDASKCGNLTFLSGCRMRSGISILQIYSQCYWDLVKGIFNRAEYNTSFETPSIRDYAWLRLTCPVHLSESNRLLLRARSF